MRESIRESVWLDDPVVAKNKRINVLNHLENSLMCGLLIKYLPRGVQKQASQILSPSECGVASHYSPKLYHWRKKARQRQMARERHKMVECDMAKRDGYGRDGITIEKMTPGQTRDEKCQMERFEYYTP